MNSFKTMRTLYKKTANPGDWLQDITGVYEVIDTSDRNRVHLKEVFFLDPNDLTSESNYYLGEEDYYLTAWEIRHLYKVNN